MLKNVKATYQWLVNCIFANWICKKIEVYASQKPSSFRPFDSSLKNVQHTESLQHEAEPQYVYFWGIIWKILRFMVNQRGIKINLEKIQTMLKMKACRILKEV